MTREIRVAAGAVATVLALGACAAPPPPDGAWILTPLSYDNRMDGESTARMLDVTYPMEVTSDTAGGIWGQSAGSWLHLDADGTTLRRFNLDLGDGPAPPHRGVAALDPERLVVSADGAGIHLFDTAAGTWEPLLQGMSPLGDIAVYDGDVYLVAFDTGDRVFDIRRLDLSEGGDPEVVSPPLPWPPSTTTNSITDSVALDVGDDGTLYVATQTERIVLAPDGEIVERAPQTSAYPEVEAGPGGLVAWSGRSPEDADAVVYVDGGSAEARAIVTRESDCGEQDLVVGTGVRGVALPSPCRPQGIAWVAPDAFVVSTGGEGGAVLVRVTLP